MEISVPVLDALGEAAKGFIQKVITPPLEEVGLLMADQIKTWRFKNQVRIVTRAEEYLKSKNIKTKKIDLKVMAPLLEGAAMEEDESLQEKWAALLANTVEEKSQINTTTIYSYILAQLTKDDAEALEIIYARLIEKYFEKIDIIVLDGFSVNGISFTKKGEEKRAAIIADNLIRLRLLKDAPNRHSSAGPVYSMTDLGLSFSLACRFKE